MNENTITLNQCNIIGQKIDVDINKIRNNGKLEFVILKNFNITNEIIKVLETLKKLEKIWFINCNIVEKIKIQNIDNIRIENCENVSNINYEPKINYLYINNCKEFDINTIINLDLKGFELEYTIPKNLQMLYKMTNLEELGLKDLDLKSANFIIPSSLKKVVFNGSKIDNKDAVIKFFENKNIQIEFTEQNLPIG